MKSFRYQWTEESVRNYFDMWSDGRFAPQEDSATTLKKELLRILRKHVHLKGKILDFGCGYGDLLSGIQEKNCQLYGVDYSPERVKKANQTLASQKNFCKVELFSPNFFERNKNQFDTILSTAVLEHLFPEKLPSTVKALCDCLKPKGKIFINVPNEDNLECQSDFCPNCGAFFNREQHLTSFNSQKLKNVMQKAGFKTLACYSTVITNRRITSLYFKIFNSLFHITSPELFYIGQKV
ncbi:MAG: class I SAM-dependent methyltransferase [Opitutales bacterium]|nr:class I SAM-dependent methyltransferase [Opitutales bacterium]